jgi:hypothetical protein
MFECIGVATASVLVSGGDDVSGVRGALIGPLCQLLDKNVTEYIPYALQVLALLVETTPVGSPQVEVFKHLFAMLMNEELWKNFSLVPGIVRISQAYLVRGKDVYSEVLIGGIGTLASRASMLAGTVKFESVGFDLINMIFAQTDVPEQVLNQIILGLLTRIHHKKTEKLIRQFAISLSVLVSTNGVDKLLGVVEKIQPGLSTQVVRDLWMHGIGSMNFSSCSSKHSKVVLVAIASVLGNPSAISGNAELIMSVLTATMNFLVVNPGKEVLASGPAVVGGDEDLSPDGFEVSYAKLASTSNTITDKDFIPHIQVDAVHSLKQVLKNVPTTAQLPPLAHWASQ